MRLLWKLCILVKRSNFFPDDAGSPAEAGGRVAAAAGADQSLRRRGGHGRRQEKGELTCHNLSGWHHRCAFLQSLENKLSLIKLASKSRTTLQHHCVVYRVSKTAQVWSNRLHTIIMSIRMTASLCIFTKSVKELKTEQAFFIKLLNMTGCWAFLPASRTSLIHLLHMTGFFCIFTVSENRAWLWWNCFSGWDRSGLVGWPDAPESLRRGPDQRHEPGTTEGRWVASSVQEFKSH